MATFPKYAARWAIALACLSMVWAADDANFVRVSGDKLVSDCGDFNVVGWNGWYTLGYASNKKSVSGYSDGKAYLTSLFKQAQEMNFNVFRFFVQGDYSYLTTSPGVYDESVFQGFDFVLDEASKYNIKLTPVLLNLWNDDGVPLFEKFCGSDKSNFKPTPAIDLRKGSTLNETERIQTPYKWYTDSDCRQYVKDFITKIVNRKNTINGRVYREDPTIFSWNLLNEPRCKYCGPEAVTEWYTDIAAHMKSVDPNHLVTTGEEGFFDESSKYASADPNDGNMWGVRTGQDFVANHASPDIDFAVIHLWPNNWGALDIGFGRKWVSSHIQAAQDLGKPLIVEEFGKAVSTESQLNSIRNPWYQLVFDASAQSIESGGVLRGAMFWLWDGTDTTVSENPIIVQSDDSTMQSIILPFAEQYVAGCGSREESTAPAPNATAFSESSPGTITLVSAAGRKLLGSL